MIYLLSNGKQLIIEYGNPHLREYNILARSVERLDMQSLFDSFEETIPLPGSTGIKTHCLRDMNSMACLLPLYLFTHLSNSYLGMSDII